MENEIELTKSIELNLLYDIYGKLLTKRQQEIFELYYLSNLSLREIAENKKISYQGVRDSLKTSENMLSNFEDAMKIHKLLDMVDNLILDCDESDKIDKKYIILKLKKLREYKRR